MKCLLFAAALTLPTVPAGRASPRVSAAQCKTADQIVSKRIRFAKGRTTAVVKDRVRLCTSHEYRLSARAGQTMGVNLAAGRRTSMTVRTPAGDALADGEKSWSGELAESGEYSIEIGTDETAAYTLEVTIR